MRKFIHLSLIAISVIAISVIAIWVFYSGITPVLAQPGDSVRGVFAAPSANVNRPIRDKWALVVGVSNFQNPAIPGLKYAAKDARDFREFLIREANFAPDHVRLLLDDQATQRRMLSELGNKFLARVAKPDDLVVLFFSSHGSPSQADVRGKNFVVAYDSDPDDLFSTGVEMDKIVESIQARVLSERVLLVLDACHSGAMASNSKGLARGANFDAEEIAQGSGQLVICSSAPDQQSWESKRYQNGIFTRKLLESLRMKGMKTTLGDAFPYIQQSVAAEVQEDYGSKQSPSLRSKWSGNELVLAAMPAAPQAVPLAVKQMLPPDSTFPRQSPPRPPVRPPVNPLPNAAVKTRMGAASSPVSALRTGAASSPGAALRNGARTSSGAALPSAPGYANRSPYTRQQLYNYYYGNQNRSNASPVQSTGAPSEYAKSGYAKSGIRTFISAEIQSQVRAKLPRIQPLKVERPYLSDVLNWTLQERAAYLSESLTRIDVARQKLDEANNWLLRAKNAGAALVPATRPYGESEIDYRTHLAEGQSLLDQMLVPYMTEVDLRTRRVTDEQALNQACQAAYNQLYSGGVIYGTPTTNTNCPPKK